MNTLKIKNKKHEIHLKLDYLTLKLENENLHKIRENLSWIVTNSNIKIDFNNTEFDILLDSEELLYKTYSIYDKNKNKLAQILLMNSPTSVLQKSTSIPPEKYQSIFHRIRYKAEIHDSFSDLSENDLLVVTKMNKDYIDKQRLNSKIYNKITFYGLYFALYNYDYFDEILEFVALDKKTAVPTRFDVNADIYGISPDTLEFKTQFKKKVRMRGEDITWRLIDMERYVFRQYDKLLDIKDKKLFKLQNNRWEMPYKKIYDDALGKNITLTRLEFQINSKIIREYNYKLEDILKKEVQQKEFFNHIKSLFTIESIKKITLPAHKKKKITNTVFHTTRQEEIAKRMHNIKREIQELCFLVPNTYNLHLLEIFNSIENQGDGFDFFRAKDSLMF